MENKNLAGLHYRVERIESLILTRMMHLAAPTATGLRRAPLMAMPVADPNRPLVMQEASRAEIAENAQADLVRIFDREGNVVWYREFRWRAEGQRKEKEIMDDLLRLEVMTFRQKHGIMPERPSAVEAAGEFTPPPEVDPWAGLPRPRRNLLDD